MRSLTSIGAAVMAGGLGLFALAQVSIAQGPPMPGTLLAEGYLGSIGTTVDDQCNLYVAEGGTGGEEPVTIPGVGDVYPGETGQVTMVDADGEKTVVAEGIFSVHFGDGMGSGVADVAFLDGDLYYLLTSAAEPYATNGIYLVEDDGTSTLIADIGAFNLANTPDFPDAIPEGNPFAFAPYMDGFVVTDGNFNRLLEVGLDGSIEVIAQLGNVVPTGVTVSPDGDIVWSQIGPFPHTPEDGKVMTLVDGTPTEVASGLANVISVAYDDDGTLYALTIGDQDPSGEAPAAPFTGKIAIVEDDGTLTPVVEGFMFSTSLEICDGDAYVTGLTGETRVVEDIATQEPLPTPTPEPTATPTQPAPTATATQPAPTATTVVPGPPATGTGMTTDSGTMTWLAALGLFAVASGAGMVAMGRRRA